MAEEITTAKTRESFKDFGVRSVRSLMQTPLYMSRDLHNFL